MERYYLRYSISNRLLAIILSALFSIVLFLFTAFLYYNTPAPWWTLLPLLVAVPVLIVLFWRRNTFFYIDTKTLELWAGNDLARKPHRICRFQDLLELRYLKHTKEVKITKGDGTDFYKFKDGEAFVAEVQKAFEGLDFSSKEDKKKESSK